jgi:hypothetical protein
MLVNNNHLTMLNSPRQTIRGRVELYKGSSLERICTCSDILSELQVERTGEGKFFGFGICQKLRTSLIDIDRELDITKEHTAEVAFGVNSEYMYPFPRFYVQDVERDEVSNMVTVTAYDILFKAETYKITDLPIATISTIRGMAAACATLLGIPITFKNVNAETFEVYFPEGANFDGTESVRTVLNAIAEATQTIYYVNNQWELTFQRLDKDAELAITVDKAKYMDLKSGENRTLTNITHTTELGDNTSTVGDGTGVTQFVRENPFWELRDDIAELLTQAQANIAGLTINQFEAYWSGNYLLEIGDRFGFIGENNETISTFLLDDTITFAGTLEEQSRWQYDENEGETESNPVTLGDALNQTYARVDKVNKRIDLVVSDVGDHETRLSQLTLDTEGITATVSSIQTTTNDSISSLNGAVETLTKSVEAKMTPEQVSLAIKSELDNGVDKVTTSTGFTFNETGLTVSKTGREMTTTITEDGMTVYRDSSAVLTANNTGVNAENLHATTYLIIGGRSRFENYESDRTGCLWIGGTD